MKRFIAFSFFAATLLSSATTFGQKHQVVENRYFEQESNPTLNETENTAEYAAEKNKLSVNVDSYPSSNYLAIEILGAKAATDFKITNEQGKLMYSGSIQGMQLIDIESWEPGTYTFLCGSKLEHIYVNR